MSLTSAQIEGNTFLTYNESSHEMKYLQLVNLIAGDNVIVTGLVQGQEPYDWLLLDSSGNDISDCILSVSLVAGFYNILISVDISMNNVKLKIIY
jgi:hypothetical protein